MRKTKLTANFSLYIYPPMKKSRHNSASPLMTALVLAILLLLAVIPVSAQRQFPPAERLGRGAVALPANSGSGLEPDQRNLHASRCHQSRSNGYLLSQRALRRCRPIRQYHHHCWGRKRVHDKQSEVANRCKDDFFGFIQPQRAACQLYPSWHLHPSRTKGINKINCFSFLQLQTVRDLFRWSFIIIS